MLVFLIFFFFFFQAEDGIRDLTVTWSSDECSSDLLTSATALCGLASALTCALLGGLASAALACALLGGLASTTALGCLAAALLGCALTSACALGRLACATALRGLLRRLARCCCALRLCARRLRLLGLGLTFDHCVSPLRGVDPVFPPGARLAIGRTFIHELRSHQRKRVSASMCTQGGRRDPPANIFTLVVSKRKHFI